MSNEKRNLNEMETEKVSGGGDPYDLSGGRKYMKHRCRKCGKKYIIPDMMVPEDYGDSSLCPECNRKKD